MTRLLALALLAAIAGTACAGETPPAAPTTAVADPAMAMPAPKGLGHIRGYVHGAEGQAHPAAEAVVKIADKLIRVANPGDPIETHEQDDGRIISVMYDFDDGEGPVLAERRPRKFLAPGDHPLERKYVYLRRGEFLAEGLQPGKHTLTIAYDEVSVQAEVAIAAGKTLTGQRYQLEVYTPVANEDGSTPRVVDLASVEPAAGLEALIDRPEGQPAAVRFAAAPTLKVSLKAPPGSAGHTVTHVRLSYAWREGETQKRSAEATVALTPVTVSAGHRITYGQPAELTVTLPVEPLSAALAAAEDPAGLEAVLHFLDAEGQPLETRTLEPLEARMPIMITPSPLVGEESPVQGQVGG